eukprot:GHVO01058430.1.p1 GENE.GHVO01058430.1~~GHVO01058430.1.p1  ORF type:complete len:118 (+),score=7.70 GHVO01058430.1:311-664(+)
MELNELKAQINTTCDKLREIAGNVKSSGINAVNKRADYEGKKNKYLIELAAEDKKRTVALQQAMYRKMYEQERLEWQLAEREYDANKDVMKCALATLNALQTQARLLETEINMTKYD